MSKATSFVKHPYSVVAPDGAHPSWKVNTLYDNAEFNVTTATTDYNVKTNQTTTFGGASSKVGVLARYISIRTNKTITVKFNATGNHSITITSSDSPLTLDNLEVSNIFISNASGDTAAIKVFLMG